MSNYEQRILDFMKSRDRPATDTELRKEFPDLSNAERAGVMQILLNEGLIDLFQTSDKKLAYKIKAASDNIESLKGAGNEEKVVYGIVKESGNKGIWIKDIRQKSNLIQLQLNKIIKNLENKKAIKLVKSVKAGKKKVYMLYDLEPDRSLTGGAWYSDQDFESEFVDVLNQQCYKFLETKREKAREAVGSPLTINNNSYASVIDVWKFINQLGISRIELSEDDIKTILQTLIYDGKVERKLTIGGGHLYKAIETLLPPPGLARTTCGICPVFKNCDAVGTVNPKTCSYYNDWLL
ncbi:DNA-directed RNA polymerase III subunit RPC6 [Planococcus citri]|uniref:DNA-directed RNA polymerase III subunit RPC6 n=1 Tax=Planococcus citri TaxID=170843 RepID=UPI0031F91AAC